MNLERCQCLVLTNFGGGGGIGPADNVPGDHKHKGDHDRKGDHDPQGRRRPQGRQTHPKVLGMHRSGTSAVVRVLSLLGAALPRRLLDASRGNEAGHWEPQFLMDLHHKMLIEAGNRWDDWRAFDPKALSPERAAHYKGEIKRLIAEEYGEASLFVIKDPRICRFVPLYEEILAELGIVNRFILLNRNPLAVVASLEKRDGMDRNFAGLVWLRHVLDAEAATRGKKRALLSYENFLDDWRGTIARVTESLGLDWPNRIEDAAGEIELHLTRSRQHFAPSLAELDADSNSEAWTRESYAALRKLERHRAENGAALKQLSRVKAEFEASSAIFVKAMFPAIAALTQDRDAARSEEKRLRDVLDAVYASTSWRISSPLRALKVGMRAIANMPSAARAVSALRAYQTWQKLPVVDPRQAEAEERGLQGPAFHLPQDRAYRAWRKFRQCLILKFGE